MIPEYLSEIQYFAPSRRQEISDITIQSNLYMQVRMHYGIDKKNLHCEKLMDLDNSEKRANTKAIWNKDLQYQGYHDSMSGLDGASLPFQGMGGNYSPH